LAAVIGFLGVTVALASSAATTSTSRVAATCTIASADALNFGNQGILAANVDQSATIEVMCTNATPYTIALDVGTGADATVAARKMTSDGDTVDYSLYSDSAHTAVWGSTVGTDAVAAAGNDTGQSYTVYGRVPPQAAPAAGTYADTITVTVTY
jgi:spore coat protein U-like protein